MQEEKSYIAIGGYRNIMTFDQRRGKENRRGYIFCNLSNKKKYIYRIKYSKDTRNKI